MYIYGGGFLWASLIAQLVKNPPQCRRLWFNFFGSGRPAGEGIGYPLQYSGLENSTDWIVHRVTRSWAWLSDFHFHGGGLVAKLCPTLCDPMDYTVHRIFQARILEWVTYPFSSRSSWPRVSCVAGGFFTSWATILLPHLADKTLRG